MRRIYMDREYNSGWVFDKVASRKPRCNWIWWWFVIVQKTDALPLVNNNEVNVQIRPRLRLTLRDLRHSTPRTRMTKATSLLGGQWQVRDLNWAKYWLKCLRLIVNHTKIGIASTGEETTDIHSQKVYTCQDYHIFQYPSCGWRMWLSPGWCWLETKRNGTSKNKESGQVNLINFRCRPKAGFHPCLLERKDNLLCSVSNGVFESIQYLVPILWMLVCVLFDDGSGCEVFLHMRLTGCPIKDSRVP